MVRESGVEDYIVDELVRRGWRYVDSSGLDREGLDKPLLYGVLRRRIHGFNPGVSGDDVSEAISIFEGRGYSPRGAREVLEYLKFGVPVKLSRSRISARLKLIDYNSPDRNEFIVSRQVPHVGVRGIRNDIILYVNGIPLVNIEVKNPSEPGVSWRDAFIQIKRYEGYVPELYKYVQIGVAVEAEAKYFPIVPWVKPESTPIYEWRVEGLDPVDSLIDMLHPHRLLDILRYYLYFRLEEGRETKIIARYMQYRAANRIVERVLNRVRGVDDRDRGLIWHWQGSGKTLTMIFVAMKLYWLLENPMILFVVDRIELQNQLYYENLTKLDLGPEVKPKLVDSINRLRQVLSYNDYRGEPGLFVVTVQKFRPRDFELLEKMIESISSSRTGTVMDRRDIVVFVDEAHRTQYGVLAEQMMRILRNANYYAFTGTPVPRRDPSKNTFAKFSPPGEVYLDKYFILDSIRDGYTVRIAYQPGPFDYKLQRKLLEEFLESEFEELPENIRRRVERRIGRELDIRRFKIFLEDPGRIDRVSRYIAKHFLENVNGRFKAMVVAASRKACVLYKRILDKYLPPEYSEVVMTFQNVEREDIIEEYKRELMERYHTSDPREAVRRIVERFRTEDNPRILIVTDMLLTGFDAPILQTMYLDKPLKGHRLLQAIARVNRPYMGVKEYGLIIDFIGIFDELEKAFAMYEREDLRGAIYDMDELLSRFRRILGELLDRIGHRPGTDRDDILYRYEKMKVEEIARDKKLERYFIENYRILRKLYEIIESKLSHSERLEYKWLSDIYTIYIKNIKGSDPVEEALVERYFKRTVEAIGRSLEIIEKDIRFTPITIDRGFFEKYIRRRDISVGEKASALIMGLARFRLYARRDPIYFSVIDKIEELLNKWRGRIRRSIELYEEAKRIWEMIYELREERSRVKLSDREYMVYRILVDAGVDGEDAMRITNRLMEKIKDIVSVRGWFNNPKLVRDVEKNIALTILLEARGIALPKERIKKLIDSIIEGVKKIENTQ